MTSTILVIGSQLAAADGTYQSLVTELSSSGLVEMQMVDRIVDGGKFDFIPLSSFFPFSFFSISSFVGQMSS